MDEIIALIAEADKRLDTITVSGVNAFAMVNARRLLKAAFDRLNSLQKSEAKEE